MKTQSPKRRTNAERSAETKRKLLDAAEQCLIDLGYTHTTNAEVCQRAGVSNGSLLHHFRTRENLLASTLERLYGQLKRQVIGELEEVEPGPMRVDRAVDALWSVFDCDEFKVVLELWLAAANDATLRKRVLPVMEDFGDSIYPAAVLAIPASVEPTSHFIETFRVVFSAMEGVGLVRSTFRPENMEGPSMRKTMKEMLHQAIEKDGS